MNSRRPQEWYEFGSFRLDPSEHVLLSNGQVVPLEPKVFDLLKVLVLNGGRLLQKDELLQEVWPDTFVEEGNLNRNIQFSERLWVRTLLETPISRLFPNGATDSSPVSRRQPATALG